MNRWISFLPSLRSRNRESARKVAALEPSIVCFAHGPPLLGRELTDFVAKLPVATEADRLR